MSQTEANYTVVQNSFSITGKPYDTSELAICVVKVNKYLAELHKLFDELNFNIFVVMGQRNISGVIGEIFTKFFCMQFESFLSNPHPDGRPDILQISDEGTKKYFEEECFLYDGDKRIPIKSKFAPFAFDGIEVKCTIGDHRSNYKRDLKEKLDRDSFVIGIPRIEYLNNLTYWAHHAHSCNLFGLYYDYYPPAECVPQILAVMCATLSEGDWHAVSVGLPHKKKTSNTSLNSNGVKKIKNGCLLVINDTLYIQTLQRVGISL